MVMNKIGQTALLAIMVGVFVFMLAMVFINPIKSVITQARSSTQLDCANSSISDGNKMTCLAVDLILPYFICIVLGIAGAWFSAKIMIG